MDTLDNLDNSDTLVIFDLIPFDHFDHFDHFKKNENLDLTHLCTNFVLVMMGSESNLKFRHF